MLLHGALGLHRIVCADSGDDLAVLAEDHGQPSLLFEREVTHAVELRNVLADDVHAPSLPTEAALAGAPQREGDFFAVPKVIGDSQ